MGCSARREDWREGKRVFLLLHGEVLGAEFIYAFTDHEFPTHFNRIESPNTFSKVLDMFIMMRGEASARAYVCTI